MTERVSERERERAEEWQEVAVLLLLTLLRHIVGQRQRS